MEYSFLFRNPFFFQYTPSAKRKLVPRTNIQMLFIKKYYNDYSIKKISRKLPYPKLDPGSITGI